MGLNLALVVLVGLNLWLRWNGVAEALPITLSGVGIVVLGVSGWLGGHLVHVLGVTVGPRAAAPGHELGAEAGVVLPRVDPAPRGR
jgi:uncharacterized membrane protein